MLTEKSHILSLIDDAFKKVQEFSYERYLKSLKDTSRRISLQKLLRYGHLVNLVLEKFGLHLMYKSVFKELESNSYSKMGKWSSVGTLQLALKNPEEFDKVYNLLLDEDSKNTFDWFIQYRLAYAFLGELGGEVVPTKISKKDFSGKMGQLKLVKHSSLINVGGYYLDSEIGTTAQSWIFEQYEAKDKCEVSEGDHIIDGGAFKGETSFWFLSKGAGKVYAFEPDPNIFSILSENIKRNKAADKIIAVQKILSSRIGTFSLYTASSGGSATHEGGNETVQGTTLDSFVENEGLDRVDFIKLDVEGAELEVLEGAAETIKKFKPKMAISVYHKPEDIIAIPKFILETLPDAKFYLSHKYYSLYETVLFVNPRDGKLL